MIDLLKIPIIDNHCHPLLDEGEESIEDRFSSFFTEGRNNPYNKDGILYLHVIKDLASLLSCDETIEAVLKSRRSYSRNEYIKTLFIDANIDTLLMDIGYPPDALSIEQLRKVIPCKIKKIIRIENIIEDLLRKCNTFDELETEYLQILNSNAQNNDVVAFKSIIAYRSGLEIKDFRKEDITKEFQLLKKFNNNKSKIKLRSKPILDYFLKLSLRIGAKYKLPFQIHTGFGDPDLNLLTANPILLQHIFQDEDIGNIVLLHGGYPYLRETGYLASIYPNVFVDLSLMIPFVQHGMTGGILNILELAPYSKVLYGSDGFCIPELYWIGAKHGRIALSRALQHIIELGEISPMKAIEIGEHILYKNAKSLYIEKNKRNKENRPYLINGTNS